MNYTYLFDAASTLLAGWIVAVLAVSVIAFGKDVMRLRGGHRTLPSKR